MSVVRALAIAVLACELAVVPVAFADSALPPDPGASGFSPAGAADGGSASGAVAAAGLEMATIRADVAASPDAAAAGEGSHGGGAAIGLSAERARLLLRSLTVPGWGQATSGHPRAATVFGLAEVGVWTSFTAFRIQSQLRRLTYERTASLFAGIDIGGRDEEFRRIIGFYLSSDEYNHLVVYREAANLYYDDPVAYRRYIAEHSVGGSDAWSWNSEANLLRYRAQRKDAQRASIRANTALACAVVNRLLSMVHAARIHAATDAKPRSWNFEIVPAPAEDALAYRMGVRARF